MLKGQSKPIPIPGSFFGKPESTPASLEIRKSFFEDKKIKALMSLLKSYHYDLKFYPPFSAMKSQFLINRFINEYLGEEYNYSHAAKTYCSDCYTLVIKKNNCISATCIFTKEGELFSLVSVPFDHDARLKGAGSLLVALALKISNSLRIESSYKAQGFYERLGAEATPRDRHYFLSVSWEDIFKNALKDYIKPYLFSKSLVEENCEDGENWDNEYADEQNEPLIFNLEEESPRPKNICRLI